MKKLLVIIVCAAAGQLANGQTILRVNNNFGVTGVNVYTTPQAAHDAASANDILIIEPSLVSYGDLTLTKPLKIYGNGYYLHINTQLRVDQRRSEMGTVIFNAGSSGSYIAGIALNIIYTRSVSNVTVTRCSIGNKIEIHNTNVAGSGPTNVTDITIAKNIISGVIALPTASYFVSNVSVSNNILQDLRAGVIGVQSWIVKNNTFYNNGGCCPTVPINLHNSVFDNNLITVPSHVSYGYELAFTNTTASYNVNYSTLFSAVDGNQNNVDVAAELVLSAGLSLDETYQLKAGSALKTAGFGGIEVGAFGGPTPYVISGTASIPTISKMHTTSEGSNSSPLHVTISVKSNN